MTGFPSTAKKDISQLIQLFKSIASVALCLWPMVVAGQYSELNFKNITSQQGLSHNTVTCIGQDSLGFMWFGTFNGLNRFDGYDFKQYKADPKNPQGLTINRIINICSDSHGDLWVRTIDSIVHRYDYEMDDFVRLKPTEVPAEVKQIIKAQYAEERFTFENHLFRFHREKIRNFIHVDLATGEITENVVDKNDPQGIQDNYITSLFVDKYHSVWVGTFNSGIYVAELARKPFKHFMVNDGVKYSDINNIRAIYQDEDKYLWLGTRDNGFLKIDWKYKLLAHFKNDPKNSNSLTSNDVRKIYKDRKGRMWIATRGGVSLFDVKRERFTTVLKGSIDDIPSYVFNVFEDHNGDIWFATLSGLGKYDEKSRTIIKLGEENGVVSHPALRTIIEDVENNLWLGSEIGGITCLKRTGLPNAFESTRYLSAPLNPTGLSDNRIYSVCKDETGALWFGTGTGLNRFDPQTRTFDVIREKDGLANDMIMGILPDFNGHVWVSHKRGISKVGIHTHTIVNYSIADGLQDTEFNEDAYFRNPVTGELFFGGPKGINHFYPQSIKRNVVSPKVLITDFFIQGQSVGMNDTVNNRVILKKSISLTSKIDLSYYDKSFAFAFSALSYSSPENNHYAFMLEGFDKSWNYVDSKIRRAFYTNLEPGKYLFKVKACNNDGVWTEKPTELYIVVHPPLWKQLWFRFALVLIFAVALILIIALRFNRLAKQKLLLEEKVAERTNELNASNREIIEKIERIGEQNTIILGKNEEIVAQSEMLMEQKKKLEIAFEELDLYRGQLERLVDERTHELFLAKEKAEASDRMKTSFLSNLSHEVRTPLNAIMGFSSFLLDDNFDTAEKGDFKTIVDDNCNALLFLIEDIVNYAKIEAEDVELDFAKISVSNVMLQLPKVYDEEKKRQQTSAGQQKNIEFKVNCPSSVNNRFFFTDETKVVQVFAYLLNNAIKFTDSGFVEAGCTFDPEIQRLRFYVTDSGIGISREDQDYIFNSFRKVELSNANVYRGIGLGLSIAFKLVKLLGGQMFIESELGKGSTFCFSLPMEIQTVAKAHENSSDVPDLQRHTILIADDDDDETNYLHLQHLLGKTGAALIHIENGKQLLDIINSEPVVSLVLVDIKMAETDGYAALQRLDEKNIDIPVVALVPHAFPNNSERIKGAGFTDCLTKPIYKHDLYSMLYHFLG